MREKILAVRYADAYMGFSGKSRDVQGSADEIKKLKTLIQENPLFYDFLKSRDVTYAEKCAFIDETLKRDFSEELRHFLKLLLKKNRLYIISAVANYVREQYAQGDTVNALLMSSYPLDAESIESIKVKLEKKLHKKLKLYLGIDGDLLGGVRVIIGNKVIDGSVRRRLGELKERLLSLQVA